MARSRLASLLEGYDRSIRRCRGESEESIGILKSIVQACVEDNDDEAGYRYQQKVYDAYVGLYGENYLWTERAALYCRELMIRTSPLSDRVRLCRDFWQDVREDYGERSVTLAMLAPLYLACCGDAGEIEELRQVCAEVAALFGGSEDAEIRQLAVMCSEFDVLMGDKSGDLWQLEEACLRAEAVLGRDSLHELLLRSSIALLHRKNGENERAAEIRRGICRISQERYGINALNTIRFRKDLVLELAIAGHTGEALREAKRLSRAVQMCPDRNLCPDIHECFVMIYSKMGKKGLIGKYGRMSVAYNEENLGSQDIQTLKSRFIMGVRSFLLRRGDGRAAFREMLEYMTAKERKLYNVFLLSSDIRREKYFAMQDRGEYDMCLGTVLSRRRVSLADEDLLALWEVICNYKTLMGDCEFLHGAMRQRQDMASELDSLRATAQSGDGEAAAGAERRLLELSRMADFPGYMEAVHVRDIRDMLREDEMLLDYYCVRFSDLEVYAAMAVTRHSIELVRLGSVDEADGLARKLTEPDGIPEGLPPRLQALLLPEGRRARRMIICPDGELYRFAFDIVFPETEIVYVTSPKDIARRRRGTPRAGRPDGAVHVFADPDFDLSQEQVSADPESAAPERCAVFRRLPGTLVEARILKGIYGNRVRAFTRRDANVQAFMRNCSADIVHIGTHADSDNGGRIYLAGAGCAQPAEGHPVYGRGYLTPQDIAALGMQGTGLLVLSACRTGIGEYRDHLGVRGLRRAFQIAGVRRIIATLWNISDIAAAIFMYQFYTHYSRQGDCAAAMEYAKQYLRTASVGEMREQIYPGISDILKHSGCMDTYRELRDIIGFGRDEERPFAAPYYWAAFALYDSFSDEGRRSGNAASVM